MRKIVSDRSGDVRKGVFYHFEVMYEDIPYAGPRPESIIVPRTPTNDTLIDADQPYYLYLEDDPRKDDEVEVRDCPASASHVTLQYYRTLHANLAGGVRIAQFIPTSPRCLSVVSEDLHGRLDSLHLKGARLDLVRIGSERHELKERNVKLWHLQFVGRARMRPPKVVDGPNLCPYCSQGKIICESCSYWPPLCEKCGQEMRVIEHKHTGTGDKRIPFDSHQETIIEGKAWDGSDLVQGCYASKRFIDWLLRVHAAPFYAEPVWFCVDGMNDQQKKWFDELQKPFEV